MENHSNSTTFICVINFVVSSDGTVTLWQMGLIMLRKKRKSYHKSFLKKGGKMKNVLGFMKPLGSHHTIWRF